jgi:hypothetical protein
MEVTIARRPRHLSECGITRSYKAMTPLHIIHCPPVLFIIFNRPEKTREVMKTIRKARPTKLYIAADGPRPGRTGEVEQCKDSRKIALDIDWPCKVSTLVHETNLGLKLAETTAMDWFFSNEPEGIILEDDTLPHPTFFRFCAELLERYRNDDRIALISGVNAQFGRKRRDDSYYFSYYSQTWGWASWRRSWKDYDMNMSLWSEVRDNSRLDDILDDPVEARHWRNIFDHAADGRISTWDYQWILSCWINNRLAILPNVNLISNIGFGPDATHTTGRSKLSNMEVQPMIFPLRHPKVILRDKDADAFTARQQYLKPSFIRRIFTRTMHLFE